jgi:hypothetical protein
MNALTLPQILIVFVLLTGVTRAQVRITEVNVQQQRVELTNFGLTSVDLATWQWCRRFVYSTVGGSIAAGETRQFTVSMDAASSDIGLFRSSLFGSSSDMEDYVQYGASFVFNGREAVAVAKGIWPSGQFLTLPAAGLSFHAKDEPPATGSRLSNWFTGRPHQGFPVPAPLFESVNVTGNEWRLVVNSYHPASALITEVNADLGTVWQLQTPTVVDLGSGRFDIRFPAAGARQFERVKARP